MKLIHYLLIAVVLLAISTGVSTYQAFQANERANALQEANDLYEEDFERLRKEHEDKIDSLQKVKEDREEQIDLRDKQIEDILANVDNILNTSPNEAAIDNIRDPDSLSHLFARYYPDKSGTGQGSD